MTTVAKRVVARLEELEADETWLRERACGLSRDGLVKLTDMIPQDVTELVRHEADRLLETHVVRYDTVLTTSDCTPRIMDVVEGVKVEEESPLIYSIYRLPEMAGLLEKISGAPILPCPVRDEELFLSRQSRVGDTHGWHWGDFTYALEWILAAPPPEAGGMLQYVPHTCWDKKNAQVNRYLCENKISTYAFASGDIYFIKTDTTMYRTVPLSRPAVRIMLNMTWAGQADAGKTLLQGDDVWWIDEPDPMRVVA